MRIIQRGTELHEYQKRGWWVGLKIECSTCGFQAILEWSDRKKVVFSGITRLNQVQLDTDCPHCFRSIRLHIEKIAFLERKQACELAKELPGDLEAPQ